MANPSNLQVTPAAVFTEYNELNFQGLYLYHTHKGPKPSQAEIVASDATLGIGSTVVNDWEVYDGPGQGAKLVARAQGLHIKAGNWLSSFSLVFVDERFSGSTLEVMGIIVEKGEWAVVGGTGQFAMATGVISKRLHEKRSDGHVIEITIRAFCPQLKGIRYPVTKIGLWGGSGGFLADIAEVPKRLESITVRSSLVVDSIAFSFIDYAGLKHSYGPTSDEGLPSSGADRSIHTIQLAESEFIIELSGTVGEYNGEDVITSIKFMTNSNKTYGPWGDGKENPFTVPVQPGSAIVGFFVRHLLALNAIGIYVRPL